MSDKFNLHSYTLDKEVLCLFMIYLACTHARHTNMYHFTVCDGNHPRINPAWVQVSSLGQLVQKLKQKHPSMKVIRHAGVDSRMIILDDQARQQMTLHFQLSLQCNVSPITGFVYA